MNNRKNNRSSRKKKRFQPGKKPGSLLLLLLFLGAGFAYLIWYNSVRENVDIISYSTFMAQVEKSNVKNIRIRDQYVEGRYRDGRMFSTYVAKTDKLWEALDKKKVTVEVFPPEKQSLGFYFLLLSLFVFLFVLFFFYFRQTQGGSGSGKIFSVGKSKARFFSPNSINVSFKDVAGVDEAKDDLKDIIAFLKKPEKFEKLGAKIPRGILLSGAPGNGKTLLAKAVAGEANCPFFSISGADFVEVFVGVGASRVRDLFAQAKKHAPCIVFIDEIDAVGRQRGIGMGGGNDEREQTLNQLLSEMDGFTTEQGAVIVLAATNRPDVLDNALLRPGRFDRLIEVPYPDLICRHKILQVHAKNVKLDIAVNLEKIAQGTAGFTGADLENLINEAALIASKKNADHITTDNFEQARDKIVLGGERKTLVLSKKEKEMVAYHEAGHSLLNLLLLDTDPFHKVTIVPRGRTLGVSWSLPERDKHSRTRTELFSRIMVSLGGLLAEKIIFQEQTTGVANDLENATKIARTMVRRYGMSESIGPIDYNVSEEHPYLGRDIQNAKEFSDNTTDRLDREIEKIMKKCYEDGEKLLRDNIDKLKLLATTLLEKETLLANEVYELLDIAPRKTHEF